jgi:hypothetical protein
MDPAIQMAIDAAVQAAEQVFQAQLQQTQQDLLAAQQQLQALQAAGVQPPVQAQAPPAPVVQPAVVFALSPGTAAGRGINNLIDYSTKTGTEVAKAATTKLSVEHDLDREHLNGFLESLRSRAIQQGWYDGIFRVQQNGIELNIIESYGTLTRTSVDAAARAHIFADNRRTQDTTNMFACLEETLTHCMLRVKDIRIDVVMD